MSMSIERIEELRILASQSATRNDQCVPWHTEPIVPVAGAELLHLLRCAEALGKLEAASTESITWHIGLRDGKWIASAFE